MIEEIQKLIAENDTSKAIEMLIDLSISRDKNLYNEILLQKNRHSSNNQKIVLGLISNEEGNKEANNINYSLLLLVSEIEKRNLQNKTPSLITRGIIEIQRIPKSILFASLILAILGLYKLYKNYSYERKNIANVDAKNPFGEKQTLINVTDLLLSSKDVLVSNDDSKLVYPKFLFQIDKPTANSSIKYELISSSDYASKISPDTGFISLSSVIKNNPALRDAVVFRLYRDPPLNISVSHKSYAGDLVSDKEYEEAQKYTYNNEFNNFFKGMSHLFTKPDMADSFNEKSFNIVDSLKGAPDSLSSKLSGAFDIFSESWEQTVTFHNELSIIIVDRKSFEKQAIASNRGRKIVTTPLFYMLGMGGELPHLDIHSIKEASISKDGKVWGFFGQNKISNVKVNGIHQEFIYNEFYRLYVVSADYIYQITLTFTPNLSTPRETWDNFSNLLKSLKIVSI